ncbi:paraquat-inducible protein A [Roseicitreum antarcticum]|uniref:Paraquat-inducible protein A n=1 Tax=Roseicitreum antarcticum TaxID=564137 RepID=A0A1H3CDG2_9RHOB|nr:paraquat-inducible protein A [Roseicitreum antarcticum]SDX52143.1 paraquat-inducible protein A [Roseicitreum antarcticum]
MSGPAHRSGTYSTARAAGLVGCRTCGKVSPRGTTLCPRCESPLKSRDHSSVQTALAWMAAGIIAYFPANIYPMLLTTTLTDAQQSTIVGGAIELIRYGEIPVALIVLIASVAIPVGKFIAIGFLAYAVKRPGTLSGHRLQHLYDMVEFIGRWSMIDVFVVAILSALVQLGLVASINPGPAAVAFALSVIFTMLSARSFDSRLIWDAVNATPDGPAPPPGHQTGPDIDPGTARHMKDR